VGEAVVVHKEEALGQLGSDLLGLSLGEGGREVLLEVAMLEVLHCDEDGVVALVPTK
jgi:hypothetical protein